MSDYTIFSHGADRHDITWPDGESATVLGSWKVAAEMASGRSIAGQLRHEVSRLRSTVLSLQECVTAIAGHQDALYEASVTLGEVKS